MADKPTAPPPPNKWSKLRLMFKAFVRYKNSEKSHNLSKTPKSQKTCKSPSLLTRVTEIGSATLKRKSPWKILGFSSTRNSFESQSSGITDDLPVFDDISVAFSNLEHQSENSLQNNLSKMKLGEIRRSNSANNRSYSKSSILSSKSSTLSSLPDPPGFKSNFQKSKLSKQSTIRSSDTISNFKHIDNIAPWIPVLYIARLKLQCGGTKAIDLFENMPIEE